VIKIHLVFPAKENTIEKKREDFFSFFLKKKKTKLKQLATCTTVHVANC